MSNRDDNNSTSVFAERMLTTIITDSTILDDFSQRLPLKNIVREQVDDAKTITEHANILGQVQNRLENLSSNLTHRRFK